MSRFRMSMDAFEQLSATFDSELIKRVRPLRETTRRAIVVAPNGAVDGVEDGTRGELVGTLVDLRGRELAAVRLDDNGETVFVPASAVRQDG